MLIQPSDVSSYSVYDQVKNRPEQLLVQDILEAEAEAARLTGHPFTDPMYTPLPEKAKLAIVKLAQYFALLNQNEAAASAYQSEKIGDYTYTVAAEGGIQKPAVYHLLSDYITPGYSSVSSSVKVRTL
ncbi:protein YqbG [Bacillus nakamurai]|uniref:protein YqbG n=1 Tax=Bacillus nakamurai TaxID=1793963 RepID=UPI0020C200D9|nr:DUF3199 family protein [Bacillus nakamurai]MCP6683788.1 DUF3199 family protein [Bacillus nakamurai]